MNTTQTADEAHQTWIKAVSLYGSPYLSYADNESRVRQYLFTALRAAASGEFPLVDAMRAHGIQVNEEKFRQFVKELAENRAQEAEFLCEALRNLEPHYHPRCAAEHFEARDQWVYIAQRM